MTILRQFVHLPEGQIHIRRVGQGPVLVMIHEMPLSSKVFIPLMKELQNEYECIAIDLPNYGDSEWSTHALTITDYATIVQATLNELGIASYLLYGVHGGASVALDVAARFADEVKALVLSGVPLFTDEERVKLHAGLKPFQFKNDGSHYQIWWENFRKKWADTTPAHIIENAVVDIVKAGSHYDVGYRAAFDYDPLPALEKVEQPIYLPIAAKDPLVSKNAQVMNLKTQVSVEIIDVPQHASQLAAPQLSQGIQKFIQTLNVKN